MGEQRASANMQAVRQNVVCIAEKEPRRGEKLHDGVGVYDLYKVRIFSRIDRRSEKVSGLLAESRKSAEG